MCLENVCYRVRPHERDPLRCFCCQEYGQCCCSIKEVEDVGRKIVWGGMLTSWMANKGPTLRLIMRGKKGQENESEKEQRRREYFICWRCSGNGEKRRTVAEWKALEPDPNWANKNICVKFFGIYCYGDKLCWWNKRKVGKNEDGAGCCQII